MQANRNGFFYILDRATGAFIDASIYVEELNWATLDENGRPVVDPRANPTEEPDYRVCPSNLGGVNWKCQSRSPVSGSTASRLLE